MLFFELCRLRRHHWLYQGMQGTLLSLEISDAADHRPWWDFMLWELFVTAKTRPLGGDKEHYSD